MLIEAYDHAIAQREVILQNIDSSKLGESLDFGEKALDRLSAIDDGVAVSGIDSSWNLIPYHGFYLYAVDAVSISEDETFPVAPRFEVNVGALGIEEGEEIVYNPRLMLQSIGMEYEYNLATETLERKDFVLVDGSVLARYYDRRLKRPMKFFEYASMLMTKKNAIFVAKTSYSNVIINGPVGDMFYFGRVASTTGYSKPYYDPIGVSVFYARLSEFAPCLKVEIPGRADEAEARIVLDVLATRSFNGYPYVLRLAHQRCRIANEDMIRLAEVLGLNIEAGGREVLGDEA